MLVALGLTYLAAPQIKALLNLSFTFNFLADVPLLAFLFTITLLVSLLAGIYPAIILSGYQPVLALKNKILAVRGGTFSLRRSLIVVQFVIAQVLIISTIVISSQLEFFRSKPLGFNKDAIITVPFPAGSKAEINRTLRNQLEQIPGIKSLSFAHFTPSSENVWWAGFTYEGADPSKELGAQQMPIDHTYLQTYGLALLAGKNLDAQTDSSYILVNESFLKYVNIPTPEAAINRQITLDNKKLRITGVVKDFHTNTLKSGISGIIMRKMPFPNIASIKLEPQNMRQTIAQIEQTWKKAYPESFFEFEFLDETIANFYREEVKMFKLFRLFAGIAIFISCLGLYGLVSFMAVQRTKEIGIRKVLGASMVNIVALFSKEFFFLILIAFAVAAPLAWYAMQAWLQDFEYRSPIGPGSFLLAILFSLIIAGITVIYRSVKAARTNPVKNLRTE
jgi:ABC-type antimicrobial peptide transport system permease subunit